MTRPMIPTPPDTIAPHDLRAARHAAGLTRDVLAVMAGIGSATITRIENGRVTPNRSTLAALARVLDAHTDERPAGDAGRSESSLGHQRHGTE